MSGSKDQLQLLQREALKTSTYLIKDISIGRGLQFRSRIVRWPIKDLAVALWCTHTLGYYWVHKLLMNEVILFNGKYITNFLEKKIMYFIRYTEKSYKRYFVLLFGWYFKLMQLKAPNLTEDCNHHQPLLYLFENCKLDRRKRKNELFFFPTFWMSFQDPYQIER